MIKLRDLLDVPKLARTVLILRRQLDHAHLLAASEEARADTAEELKESARRVAASYLTKLRAERAAHRETKIELDALKNKLALARVEFIQEDASLPDVADRGEDARAPSPSDAFREVELLRGELDAAKMQISRIAAMWDVVRATWLKGTLTIDVAERLDRAIAGVPVLAVEPEIEPVHKRGPCMACTARGVPCPFDDEPAPETRPSARAMAQEGAQS